MVRTELARSVHKDQGLNILPYEKKTRFNSLKHMNLVTGLRMGIYEDQPTHTKTGS